MPIKDPQQRLQTAGELAQLLGQWASTDSLKELTPDSLSSVADTEDLTEDRTEPQATPVTPHAQDVNRPPTRYRFAIALAGLIPLLLLAGIIFRLKFPDGGELLVECDDPNAQITVSAVQGDTTETLELSKQPNGVLTLTAGTWQLSIEGLDADSFRLSENQIVMSSSSGKQTLVVTRKLAPKPSDIPLVMTPATQPEMSEQRTGSLKGIETESRWQLGPGYPSVRGLLPQPAELPGIGRWNIRNRLTGAALMGGADQQRGALATLDPSGRFLVVSHPTTTYISEVETGNIVRVLPLPEGIGYTAIVSATRNAKRIAMLVRLGRVLIWDQRNRVAFDWELDTSLYQSGPASGETPSLRWMPDGQRILTWSSKKAQVVDQDGTIVHSVDFAKNKGPCCFVNSPNVMPDSVSISSTGNAIAFGCSDARIRVWTPTTGTWTVFEPIPYDTNHRPMFVSLVWIPDSTWLAAFGAPTPENKASFLRLFHLPSQRIFEPDGLYTFREIPFWVDNTHVQTGNRLIEVSADTKNGIARMEILPFEVDLYFPFVVPGVMASQSVVYRPDPGMPGRSDLEIWTHENRVASIPINARA